MTGTVEYLKNKTRTEDVLDEIKKSQDV